MQTKQSSMARVDGQDRTKTNPLPEMLIYRPSEGETNLTPIKLYDLECHKHYSHAT